MSWDLVDFICVFHEVWNILDKFWGNFFDKREGISFSNNNHTVFQHLTDILKKMKVLFYPHDFPTELNIFVWYDVSF